ncbi:MAG: 50S ribosomal protein L18 [Spirochaetes bacterium]|nr:50S ribosomal protein L18 [Spirochaetota bacterium]
MIKIYKREKERQLRRKHRSKKNLVVTSDRPRVCVFKSNRYIYAQIIDDIQGHTLCSYSSLVLKKKLTIDTAKEVGLALGKIASEKGIKRVVFDRNGYKFHGRVKALADGLREAGLEF